MTFRRKDSRQNTFVLFVSILLMSLFLIATAGATSPPPEYRVSYMLTASHDAADYYSENQAVVPNDAYNTTINAWDILVSPNRSSDERFLETDYLDPTESPHPESPFLYFPVLSGYWRSHQYMDFTNSTSLLALDWYCDNRSAFENKQTELLGYLDRHGFAKNTTVDLTAAIEKTKIPYQARFGGTQIPVIQYESDSTSGYFTFHSSPAFPGDKYRISYFGTTGNLSFAGQDIFPYGTPGTASLDLAGPGIQEIMVKHIYRLVDADTHPVANWGVNVSQDTAMPYFPDLSPYRGYKKLVFLKTGNPYISEVWYIDDGNFASKKQELLRYLKEHGSVSSTLLNFSQEQENATSQWNVTQFEGRDTSGYFVAKNPYIVYYGVVGTSGILDNGHPLKLLILNSFSLSDSVNTLDSPEPEYHSASVPFGFSGLLPAVIVLVALGGIALYVRYRRT